MGAFRRSGYVFLLGCITLCGTSLYGESFIRSEGKKDTSVRNVILLIGDGMGPSYTTAYRYFKNKPFADEMEKAAWDPYLVGTQMTYPHDSKDNVTDSAAAATAMATGVKSYNGAIAVDVDKKPLETVLERAKRAGKSTGLIATSKITDATPACFASHIVSRWNDHDIADQYFDDKINEEHKVDVLLGGGRDDFMRSDRNLVNEFANAGYGYVKSAEELKTDTSRKILGLFAPGYLPKMIDRTNDIPSLREMEEVAIQRLNQNERGFFLMVEGSQIDIAGHRNDIVGVMSEMTDFEEAFKAAIDFARKDQHTLVIATADHSTGGLTVGANQVYGWDPVPVKQAKKTAEFMAAEVKQGTDVEDVFRKHVSFSLTPEEISLLRSAGDENMLSTICKVFATRSHTGWTTKGHTGDDISVYAFGPGYQMFQGVNENTNIAQSIFRLIR